MDENDTRKALRTLRLEVKDMALETRMMMMYIREVADGCLSLTCRINVQRNINEYDQSYAAIYDYFNWSASYCVDLNCDLQCSRLGNGRSFFLTDSVLNEGSQSEEEEAGENVDRSCISASSSESDEYQLLGEEDFYPSPLNVEEYSEEKSIRDPSHFDGYWLQKRDPAFTPYISVGALSNMHQFFENLKGNLDSLEKLPESDRAALVVKQGPAAEPETRAFRPPATAAYLHAIRNQRPSRRIRNFVENSEPSALRGSNNYDPSYLWSGLGRKR